MGMNIGMSLASVTEHFKNLNDGMDRDPTWFTPPTVDPATAEAAANHEGTHATNLSDTMRDLLGGSENNQGLFAKIGESLENFGPLAEGLREKLGDGTNINAEDVLTETQKLDQYISNSVQAQEMSDNMMESMQSMQSSAESVQQMQQMLRDMMEAQQDATTNVLDNLHASSDEPDASQSMADMFRSGAPMAALNKLHENGIDELDMDPPDPSASPFEQALHMMEGVHQSLRDNGLEVTEQDAALYAQHIETPSYMHEQEHDAGADIMA